MKKNQQVLAIAALVFAGSTQVNANWFSKQAPYERAKTTLCIAAGVAAGTIIILAKDEREEGLAAACLFGGFIGGMVRAFTIKKLDPNMHNDTNDHYNCLYQLATLGAIGALGTLATKDYSFAITGLALGSIATITQYWRQNQPA